MNSFYEKLIQKIEAVNNAKTQEEHDENYLILNSWKDGVRDCAKHLGLFISVMADADNYYLDQGINRPMCCGVWLDWEPQGLSGGRDE
jgi:hypothetical protein